VVLPYLRHDVFPAHIARKRGLVLNKIWQEWDTRHTKWAECPVNPGREVLITLEDIVCLMISSSIVTVVTPFRVRTPYTPAQANTVNIEAFTIGS